MEVLFESRRNLRAITDAVYAVQHQPEVLSEPVMCGDSAADGAAASIYGTVLHDQGMFRMWYQAWPQAWKNEDIAFVGYAESDNGIDWRKPTLNLVELEGSTANNLCDLGFHAPAVFIDPHSPAEKRYRATGCCRGAGAGRSAYFGGHVDATDFGYYTAYSADGLRWQLDEPRSRWVSQDVITSCYHPYYQQGLVAMKYMHHVRGVRRRAISSATYKDGVWSDSRTALIPDDFDDAAAINRGYMKGDYYGLGMQPAGTGTIGFLWHFRMRDMGNMLGACDVSLAYQEEPNSAWLHVPGRQDFIAAADLPWTKGGIYTASTAIEYGDQHLLYFTGAMHSHGFSWQRESREKRAQQMRDEGFMRIGLARWPKYRVFGLEADPEGQVWIDLGELPQASKLRLNFATKHDGFIKAEINGDTEHSLEQSIPLNGDSLGEDVVWTSDAAIGPGKTEVRLHLDRATVYAYEVVPA